MDLEFIKRAFDAPHEDTMMIIQLLNAEKNYKSFNKEQLVSLLSSIIRYTKTARHTKLHTYVDTKGNTQDQQVSVVMFNDILAPTYASKGFHSKRGMYKDAKFDKMNDINKIGFLLRKMTHIFYENEKKVNELLG